MPVETWGSAGETLVFLPGLGCAPRDYRPGLEALSAELRIVVPDLSFRGLTPLPHVIDEYLTVVGAIASEMAPGAPWSGHSFGALLAMLHSGDAIALAPSIPADVSFPRTFGRALWKQTRQCVGFDGAGAIRFGWRIAADYVATAAIRPRSLFPILGDLKRTPADLPPRSRRTIVYLCRRDELYRQREYELWLETAERSLDVVEVPEGHDWPVTHPDAFAERILESVRTLG